MMTSRSEYRLVLRQDNADQRLTPVGRQVGLISDARWQRFQEKQARREQELKRIRSTVIPPTKKVNDLLVSHETSPLVTGVHLDDLLKRPQLNYEVLKPVDTTRPDDLPLDVQELCQVEVKYEGYIRRQQSQIDEMRRLECKLFPEDMDYTAIAGLRLEAQEKLGKIRPRSVGQASRISGVSPADISVLLIWLEQHSRA